MELGTSVQRLRVWGPLCTHAFHWSAGERLYRNGALGDLEVEHRRENGHDFEEGGDNDAVDGGNGLGANNIINRSFGPNRDRDSYRSSLDGSVTYGSVVGDGPGSDPQVRNSLDSDGSYEEKVFPAPKILSEACYEFSSDPTKCLQIPSNQQQ